MNYETVQTSVEGPLARLTLNRPDRLNTLGATMLRELIEAAHGFDRDPGVRVVILSGAGRAFSAGIDLRDPAIAMAAPQSGKPWSERREAGQLGLRMADAIEQMRATTIAQLHGYVIGGGVVLATACDLRVAAEDTVFSIPEVDLGVPLTWGGIPRLVREIGPALTKELVITCRPFDAAEAKAAGFLNRIVEEEELDGEAEALASCGVDPQRLQDASRKEQRRRARIPDVPATSKCEIFVQLHRANR